MSNDAGHSKRGAHIVFICDRCPSFPARLSLPATEYFSIDAADERAVELGWTFQFDGDAEDGAVVCPACTKRGKGDGK